MLVLNSMKCEQPFFPMWALQHMLDLETWHLRSRRNESKDGLAYVTTNATVSFAVLDSVKIERWFSLAMFYVASNLRNIYVSGHMTGHWAAWWDTSNSVHVNFISVHMYITITHIQNGYKMDSQNSDPPILRTTSRMLKRTQFGQAPQLEQH